jgi:prepilin-type N-terminal cleavage/methylation domain-containing protein
MFTTTGNLDSLQNQRGRAAFTLVEMVVVITLSAVVFGIVVPLAESLMRRDQISRTRGLHGEQLADLAELIRTDIRHGTDASLDAGDSLVVTTSEGAPIRYELDNEGIRRAVVGGPSAESHTDLLTIGGTQSWKVEKTATGRRPLILVKLERAPTDAPPAPFLVQAELGADLPGLEQPQDLPQQRGKPSDQK